MNSSSVAKAIPGTHVRITMDTATAPFWKAAKENRLSAPQCTKCGAFHMPPRPYCPQCQNKSFDWPTLPGTGTLYSFAICHKSPFPDVEDFDYIPVIVDVDGAPGCRLVSNLVGIETAEATIGMKVRVDFNPIQDGWKVPIFYAE